MYLYIFLNYISICFINGFAVNSPLNLFFFIISHVFTDSNHLERAQHTRQQVVVTSLPVTVHFASQVQSFNISFLFCSFIIEYPHFELWFGFAVGCILPLFHKKDLLINFSFHRKLNFEQNKILILVTSF